MKIKISFVVFGLFIGLGILGLGKSVRAQTKVLDYGFEDWTTHQANTEVIGSCNGNLPHGGNFYFHQNFYEGFDPCLGTTPTGINPHTNTCESNTQRKGCPLKDDATCMSGYGMTCEQAYRQLKLQILQGKLSGSFRLQVQRFRLI